MILIIDDDEDTRANLQDILELDDYQVETADSVQSALARKNWSAISIAILDWKLPDGTAEDLMPLLHERAPHVDIVISTGAVGLSGAVTALRHGASDYVLKPIDANVLRASLARIAEKQMLAQAKARSEAAFRTLVEAAPCMIVILRPDATLLYFSPFAEELTGYDKGNVIGTDYLERFISNPQVAAAIRREMDGIVKGASTRGFENPVRCKDGSERWMVWNAQLLPDYEGSPAILAVGQDITSVKKAEEENLQAARLAGIGQMMAGIAHESGNALARSQACLEMLQLEVEENAEAMGLIARIQKAHNDLQRLYDEVRNYAAPVKLEKELWDLGKLWQQAWSKLIVQREERDAQIAEHVAEASSLRCRVDAFRMEQVLRNVLENSLAACKDPVRIEITCAEAKLRDRPALQLTIRDNGPGLTAEQRQRVFDPFFTTKTKGTGLGMAIAKRIVEAHRGEIEVSDCSSGAVFVITLPHTDSRGD